MTWCGGAATPSGVVPGPDTMRRNPESFTEERRARNRGRRDAMGRRGEGQAHRPPGPGHGHGRALPGRPQRRAHRGRRRRVLRPAAGAERRALPPHHPGHRQRRGGGPRCAPGRARHAGGQGDRHQPHGGERQRAPDHAVSHRARPGHRAVPGQERPGHHAPRHRPRLRRQGGPGGAAGPGPPRRQDLPPEARGGAEGEERHPGQGLQPAAARRRGHLRRVPRSVRAPHGAHGRRHRGTGPRRPRRRAQRAPRGGPGHLLGPRPRHLSLRDLLQPGGGRRLHRHRRRAAR